MSHFVCETDLLRYYCHGKVCASLVSLPDSPLNLLLISTLLPKSLIHFVSSYMSLGLFLRLELFFTYRRHRLFLLVLTSKLEIHSSYIFLFCTHESLAGDEERRQKYRETRRRLQATLLFPCERETVSFLEVRDGRKETRRAESQARGLLILFLIFASMSAS